MPREEGVASFAGFPKPGVLFLADLKRNNNRTWFAANKLHYDVSLKAPAKNFLAAMSVNLSKRCGAAFVGKIFRLHRDVRFARDKTPYNPFVRMAFFHKDNQAGPAHFYLSLEADKLILGVGVLAFSKQQLALYRAAISGSRRAEKLMTILAGLKDRNYRLDEPELKRVPPGYPKDHLYQAMLRRKGLALWLDMKHSDELNGPELVDFCGMHFNDMAPAYDWLMRLE